MSNQQRRQGSAILVVLGVVSVVGIVIGMLSFAATQQMRASQITREMLKARLIAESALNKAYNTIKKDFGRTDGYVDAAAFDDGSYKVTAVVLPGSTANRAQLVSEGVCGLGHAVVSMDVENRPITTPDGETSDDYFDLLFDLLVGGTLDMKGNFQASVTDIHANGDVTLTGSSATDATTVSSAGSVTWKRADGTITMLSNQTPVEILSEALNAAINQFIEYAQENNAVYASGADIPAAPPGGVSVCTGDASGWSRTGTGCFIFTGEAALQGSSLNVTSPDGYPALIILGVDEVKLNAGSYVNGAILIPNGSLKLNGHAEIHGAILVGQGMTGVGTADLYAGSGSGFSLPPDDETTDNVAVTAWH